MKRVFLAAALVLGPAVGLASADYVMIKIDVNKVVALPAGPPQPGQPGRIANNPAARKKGPDDPPLWAIAYLQLIHKPTALSDRRGNQFAEIDHPWSKHDGKTLLLKDLKTFGTIKFYQQTSVAQRFINRKKELDRDGKTAEKLLLLAQWALEHGLRAEFEQTMAELGKVEPKHKSFVAYQEVRAAMSRSLTLIDPRASAVVQELTRENFRTINSAGGHFSVLTDVHPGGQNDVDMKKWEERLEDNYRNFFYWFAARGKVLPVPGYRLVAAVVAVGKDFQRKEESYGAGPAVAPGFLIQRPNVVIYCAEPVGDEAYSKLEKYNKDEWQMVQVGRDELLSGDGLKKRPDLMNNPMLRAKLQTLALVQKSIEKESARAAVTHEGTRQLVTATGLLPRGVIAGEWAHFGLASFFETPFHAFYFGVGLPHWNYLVEFKYLKRNGVLAQSDAVLLKTIGDRYFVSANSIQQQMAVSRDEREALEPLLDDELMTARTSAWALMYYLAKHRLDGLEKYFQELSNLPRDLEFDETVLQGCFARAFGLTDPSDPSKLDMAKLTSFAEAWYSSLEGESLDLIEVQSDALKERSERGQTQAQGPAAGAKTPP